MLCERKRKRQRIGVCVGYVNKKESGDTVSVYECMLHEMKREREEQVAWVCV